VVCGGLASDRRVAGAADCRCLSVGDGTDLIGGLPPLYITVGEFDPLRDDSFGLAERTEAAAYRPSFASGREWVVERSA
jgi:acetyl esterase/lipase